jgi:putative hydrolase of HD superfamily
MTDRRLDQQVRFILEVDRLKRVSRQTLLTDGSRRENSAEHSWHLALMAIILAEYADQPLDVGRVIRMVLVHDLVEIDAGDTFAYDVQRLLDQAAREAPAAERIFGLLPADQAAEFHALWDEFEARQTPEARFAAALDRLQPLLHNMQTNGGTWREHAITRDRVDWRSAPIADASRELGAYVRALLDRAVAEGILTPPYAE